MRLKRREVFVENWVAIPNEAGSLEGPKAPLLPHMKCPQLCGEAGCIDVEAGLLLNREFPPRKSNEAFVHGLARRTGYGVAQRRQPSLS